MFKKLHILGITNKFGGNYQTVSLDTSLLPDNTLRYLFSGGYMQIFYPVTDASGQTQIVYLPLLENGLRYTDEFTIDKQKTPIVYFTCRDALRLYIYGCNSDLISCQIVVPNTFDFDVTCVGDITVTSYPNGEERTDTFSGLSGYNIYRNSNLEKGVTVSGNVTKLTNWTNDTFAALFGLYIKSDTLAQLSLGKSSKMSKLDLSYVPKLQVLEIWGERLVSLNILKNTELLMMNLHNCYKLSTIYTRAVNSQLARNVASYISGSQVKGVVYCRSTDEHYHYIEAAAQGAGWTIREV